MFDFQDFKESPLMLTMAAIIIGFVVVESLFFMAKAWKRGKAIGMTTDQLKNTVISSALFSVAPAISILATVVVLASSLGIVLPWIRLSVVGNLLYETTAAETMLDVLGSNINTEVSEPSDFAAIAWVMTTGICFGLLLVTLIGKFIIKKISKATAKSEKSSNIADVISASAFIGIISAFVAQSINGKSSDGSSDAGFMSIVTLVSAIVIYLVFETFCQKLKLKKLELFATPLSIFGAMAVAVLLNMWLPETITSFTWWG